MIRKNSPHVKIYKNIGGLNKLLCELKTVDYETE